MAVKAFAMGVAMIVFQDAFQALKFSERIPRTGTPCIPSGVQPLPKLKRRQLRLHVFGLHDRIGEVHIEYRRANERWAPASRGVARVNPPARPNMPHIQNIFHRHDHDGVLSAPCVRDGDVSLALAKRRDGYGSAA